MRYLLLLALTFLLIPASDAQRTLLEASPAAEQARGELAHLYTEDHETSDGTAFRPSPDNLGDGTSGSCARITIPEYSNTDMFNYGATSIIVSETAQYRIQASTGFPTYGDGFSEMGAIYVYQGEFDPNDICRNLIAGAHSAAEFQNEISVMVNLERVDARAPGEYWIVVTPYWTEDDTFGDGDGGAYSIDVFGPASATVIPVELTSFEAVASGRNVNLTWATASETNNAGFEVQMRASGNDFSAVTFVDGAGTTDTPRSYSHTVNNLAPGSYTFRLRQVDFDGAFEYHGNAEIAIGVDGLFEMVAFPNPAATTTNVSLAVGDQQSVTINVFDALGRRVATLHDGQLEADRAHTFSLDTATLAPGMYIVRATGERFAETLRVTVVR